MQVFPLLYTLMSKKTKIAYKALFEYLKLKFPNFNPTQFYYDFEMSIIKSVEEIYSTTRIV